MIKSFIILFLFISCGKSGVSTKKIQQPGLEASPEHCSNFPDSIICGSKESLPELSDVQSCNDEHQFGSVKQLAHCDKLAPTPISFIFLNSNQKSLSTDIQRDAEQTIEALNSAFSHDQNQYIEFELKRVIEVEDNYFHNTGCNFLPMITDKYGSIDSLVMVFVNDLQGTCAGVSWVWTFPRSHYSVTMVEYKFPFIIGDFTPVVHEFAHTMGLHHTSNATNAAPASGLKTFNNFLDLGGRDIRRCSSDFFYFISEETTIYEENQGLIWNSYENTMYPSFGVKVDQGFFTEGYDYSMSWAFNCWNQLAQ